MTYYEELGIPSTAGVEEIHRTHRLLTKLLHPDQHLDEQLRRLADLQLRRVNTIVDCLLDPATRTAYDDSLRPVSLDAPDSPRPRPINFPVPQNSHRLWRIAAVSLFAAFAIAALAWQTPYPELRANPLPVLSGADDETAPQDSATASPSSTRIATTRRNPAATNKSKPARPVVDRDAKSPTEILTFPAASQSEPTRAAATTQRPPDPEPESQPSARQVSNQSQTASQAHGSEDVAGVWIYAPPALSGPEDNKIYRPEYIELRVRSESGVVTGQYKGRYVIPDRPISPTITFRFSGKLNGNAGSFPWKAPDGSAGKVDLKMLSARAIQVDWKTTDLRDSLGLVSGTAVLIKRGE